MNTIRVVLKIWRVLMVVCAVHRALAAFFEAVNLARDLLEAVEEHELNEAVKEELRGEAHDWR